MKKALIISFILLVSISTYAQVFIEDEAIKNLNQNLKVEKINQEPIYDEYTPKHANLNKIYVSNRENIYDEYLPKYISNKNIVNYSNKQEFNFESTENIVLKIKPVKFYSTKKDLKTGDYIDFKLEENLKIDDIVFKKGEIVKARIENIVKNGAYGTPAELTIGNFIIGSKTLDFSKEFKGADRSLWLYPTSCMANIFFGAGLLLLPIRGGHVKFKTSKIYSINI